MKKLIATLTGLLILGASALAGLPTNTVTYSIDSSKIDGSFDDFLRKVRGRESSTTTFGLRDGSTAIDLSGTVVALKASRQSDTGQVDYVSSTNLTVSTSNVTWNLAPTNVPPNGVYQVEVWAYLGATTNNVRILSQGKIKVTDSLYADGSSFPWPTSANLADYLPLAGGTMTGFLTLSGTPTASLHAATKAYADSVAAGSNIVVTAGLNIDVTTNGLERTIAAGSALATDAEVTTATNNLWTRSDATFFDIDGSKAMTGGLNMNDNLITNVGDVFMNYAATAERIWFQRSDLALSGFLYMDGSSAKSDVYLGNSSGTGRVLLQNNSSIDFTVTDTVTTNHQNLVVEGDLIVTTALKSVRTILIKDASQVQAFDVTGRTLKDTGGSTTLNATAKTLNGGWALSGGDLNGGGNKRVPVVNKLLGCWLWSLLRGC